MELKLFLLSGETNQASLSQACALQAWDKTFLTNRNDIKKIKEIKAKETLSKLGKEVWCSTDNTFCG